MSRHDIAGIWVAFFSRCQRYRCRQEAPPPTDETYVAVLLETLISINGTKAEPVKGVTVQGITFRDAADITMNPWGVPSGGDWGLYRGGAIFVEGAEDITIQHNTLTRLDGNGVFVSGYTRNVNITDSEFSWVPTPLFDRKRLPSTLHFADDKLVNALGFLCRSAATRWRAGGTRESSSGLAAAPAVV